MRAACHSAVRPARHLWQAGQLRGFQVDKASLRCGQRTQLRQPRKDLGTCAPSVAGVKKVDL
jgi:hypothetical protein